MKPLMPFEEFVLKHDYKYRFRLSDFKNRNVQYSILFCAFMSGGYSGLLLCLCFVALFCITRFLLVEK